MAQHYTTTAKYLHWLMAVTIIGLFACGLYMSELPFSPFKLKLYSWHKWFGICILILFFVRLAWRLSHRPPALPAKMSVAEKRLAHLGHGLLYLLMFLIPLSGWLMSSAAGFQVILFGIVPIPNLLAKDQVLSEQLAQLHFGLNLFMAALVIGHALVALKHHFIDKDDVLTRILPGKRSQR